MALLQIDGLTIPVETKSPRKRFEEVGAFSRSVSGSGLYGIRSAKRSWDVSTTPMSRDDAEALGGWLSGRGLYFPFINSSPNASNGYVPPSVSNITYGGGPPFGVALGGLAITPNPASAVYQIIDSTHNPFSGYDRAWSINIWAYRTASAAEYLFGAGSNAEVLIAGDAGGLMYAVLRNWSLSTAGFAMTNNAWHMITMAALALDDGTVRIELWTDGVFRQSATSVAGAMTLPSLDALTTGYLASAHNGSSRWQGALAYPQFAPARLTQRWISGLYNSAGGAFPGMWPLHRVTGTIVGGGAYNAFVRNISAEPVDAPGLVAAERLTFTLSEA